MAVLATSEDGAEDDGDAVDDDLRRAHVGPVIEHVAGIAHASAEDIGVHRTCRDRVEAAGHAEGAALHHDLAMAQHVGDLVAAVDVGEDVSSHDLDQGVAAHTACRTAPFSRSVRIIAATATEDVAIEAMAVASGVGTAVGGLGHRRVIIVVAFSVGTVFGVMVVNITLSLGFERPSVTLMEVIGSGECSVLDLIDNSGPL